ncbi:MAG: discoidin domain-containing protein [Bacteroidales bacterium]|nr:discoidin domain-containing protein [Bacteroidales bacterium]
MIVPHYTGFIGQWGNSNFSEGYLRKADIAWVGTHRHHPLRNDSYIFTHMYRFTIRLPKGAKEIVLPDCNKIAIFSMSLTTGTVHEFSPAVELLSDVKDTRTENDMDLGENLMIGAKVIGQSGRTNSWESPAFAFDEDETTRWLDADTSKVKFFEIDLNEVKPISRWHVTHDGLENPLLITSGYSLSVKENLDDKWKEIDRIENNTSNEARHKLPGTIRARYVRFQVDPSPLNLMRIVRITEVGLF